MVSQPPRDSLTAILGSSRLTSAHLGRSRLISAHLSRSWLISGARRPCCRRVFAQRCRSIGFFLRLPTVSSSVASGRRRLIVATQLSPPASMEEPPAVVAGSNPPPWLGLDDTPLAAKAAPVLATLEASQKPQQLRTLTAPDAAHGLRYRLKSTLIAAPFDAEEAAGGGGGGGGGARGVSLARYNGGEYLPLPRSRPVPLAAPPVDAMLAAALRFFDHAYGRGDAGDGERERREAARLLLTGAWLRGGTASDG